MTKIELRKTYKKLRKNLSDREILLSSQQISVNLLELEIWNFETFHIFLPIKFQREVITFFIIQHLWKRNKKVVLPKVIGQELEHFIYTPETILTKNKWEILEPESATHIAENQLDVVFIPMLICDKQGNRVGYGKGFYDKFLAKCKPDVIKIGLNYYSPIHEVKGVTNTDIPIDYCVTPAEIVSFSKGNSDS